MSTSLPDERPLASPQDSQAALYIVATPIGHLADISARAREILCAVDWVACEDTRTTRVLLNHIGSSAQSFAYHQHNERSAAARIVDLVKQGQSVAVVSDAGTPGISDPGYAVVDAAHQAGLRIVAIPGASAVTSLLSVCGFDTAEGFYFAGFLPQTGSKRRARLLELERQPGVLVFYEAPHRIAECLEDLLRQFGPDRRIVIGRELTKRFEETARMPLLACASWLLADSNRGRGEFVLALEARDSSSDTEGMRAELSLDKLLRHLLEELPVSASAKIAHKLLGIPRKQAYEHALSIAQQATPDTK